jgi:hypothetical protein
MLQPDTNKLLIHFSVKICNIFTEKKTPL